MASSGGSSGQTQANPPKGNPAFRMMGLPNFRLKLPSRNWLIFLSVTGSWTAALLYDRHEKKKAQRKWCALVSHVAHEPLPVHTLPRKVTIYLSAPPGDGLRAARDHFHEYVKPVLVAGGMDWDVVEGRREGDVRAGLAARIRKFRRRRGEDKATSADEEEESAEDAVEQLRERIGIREWEGVQGDVVIGRHTWKEYIRGLHEGWLGPLKPPDEAPGIRTEVDDVDATPQAQATDINRSSADSIKTQPHDNPTTAEAADDASGQSSPDAPPPEKNPTDTSKKPSKPSQPEPYIWPSAYSSSAPPKSFPSDLPPSTILPQPHILGFLNTPIRMYRFLTRRHLADDIGRQTAAAVLAANRPFLQSLDIPASDTGAPSSSPALSEESGASLNRRWEQQRLLELEEADWHKSVRKRSEGDKERVWLDDMALDERIAERMRKFELDASEEARAVRIAQGKEGSLIREADSGEL